MPQMDNGFIVLEHDLYQQSVDLAVGYVLPMALASGKFSLKSIISCLGKSSESDSPLNTHLAHTWKLKLTVSCFAQTRKLTSRPRRITRPRRSPPARPRTSPRQ